jgi:hypothetical protein
VVVKLSNVEQNPHSQFCGAICCVVRKLVEFKQKSTSLPMLILVWRLPNPRTTPPRDGVELLSVKPKSSQQHHLCPRSATASASSDIINSIIISSSMSIANIFPILQTPCGRGKQLAMAGTAVCRLGGRRAGARQQRSSDGQWRHW